MDEKLTLLSALEKRVLWLSTWMIHNANHIRPSDDGMKVGGHQASSASLASVMTALFFHTLRRQDRVAVKPHASPIFHAIQYLLGNQTRAKLENFRGFGGAQSYPSRTKDTDGVDFSTGSVGLGVAQTLFASLVQDYVHAKGWAADHAMGRMIALLGDAEMDEGNIFEALLEGWKQGLRNTWWVVDYNRQSLDGVVHEGLWERLESVFRNFGWDVVILKHGVKLQAAFAEPGGTDLRQWIDACPNQLYSALSFQGGAAWRKRLTADFADRPAALKLIAKRSDADLSALMANLGGHDLPSLIEAFDRAATHDRPVCFIAYTIKGSGLPLAGHKDNHAGIMTPAQMDQLRQSMNVREGHEWEPLEGLGDLAATARAFLEELPFYNESSGQLAAPVVDVPPELTLAPQRSMSTQQGFGLLMNEIAKQESPFADRVVTTSPDVTVSTNLGPWVNRRGLFATSDIGDTFRSEHIPSTFNWTYSPSGQHLELGIAEMNLFMMLSSLGLSHSLFGERLLPVGTLYDPFIERGLDALNYACYQDARFILAATPSGITLAPEGGAHQSIGTPLIGMSQAGLTCFEPAFVDELAVLLRFAFDYVQRSGSSEPDRRSWLRDARGGAVYFRLSTRLVEQPTRTIAPDLAEDMIDGGYWLRPPGPNADIVIAFTGAVAPEAIEAIGLIGEDRRDVGLLSITSADRLYAGWKEAQHARVTGTREASSHIERLLQGLPRHCGLVTVIDGHPATLAWLGSVWGHRTHALGVTEFGQTGTVADLYRHFGIDSQGIIAAADIATRGRPIRYLDAVA